MNAQGQLTEIVDGQGFMVFVPFSDTRLLEKQQITECTVNLDDGRTISREQQKKIFALIDDITVFIRGTVKKTTFYETLREMQMLYLIDSADNDEVRWKLTTYYCNLVNTDRFSLSDIDMTTAREFIDWLVEFCIIHGIPCIDTLLNRCEDTGRYLYSTLMNKVCCICGNRRSELHHVNHVGSGRNRKEIIHIGMEVISLCASHHIECHTIGQKTFNDKYKVYGIKADEEICKARKLKYK